MLRSEALHVYYQCNHYFRRYEMAGVRVVSKRSGGVKPKPGEVVVAIDRPSGSVLGNPYRRGLVHPTALEARRAEVIACFREDLVQDWRAHGPMRAELERIAELVRSGKDVALACWCAPKPCHGDIVRRAVEALLA